MNGALIIAFEDTDDNNEMTPVTDNGRLAIFATIAAGRDRAGVLGVAVPVSAARVRELCARHKLGLPDLRQLEMFGGAECSCR